jgi:hypothetical protein
VIRLRLFAAIFVAFIPVFFTGNLANSTTAPCDTYQVNGGDESFLMNLNTPLEFGGVIYDGNIYVSPKGTVTFGQGDYTFWDYPATPSISIAAYDYHAFANGVMWGAENDLYVRYGSTATSICVDWKVMLWGQSSGDPIYIRMIAEVNPENYTWTPTFQVSSNAPEGARYGVRYTQGGEVFPLTIQTITEPPAPNPTIEPTPTEEPTPEPSPSEPEPSPTPEEPETPNPTQTPLPTPIPSEPTPVEPIVPPTTPVVPEPERPSEPEPQPEPQSEPQETSSPIPPTTEPVEPSPEPLEPEPLPEPSPEPPITEPEEQLSKEELMAQLVQAAKDDDPSLPEELAAIPFIGDIAGAILDLFNNLGNVGADMTPEVRETAQKIAIVSIIVTQIVGVSTFAAMASTSRK